DGVRPRRGQGVVSDGGAGGVLVEREQVAGGGIQRDLRREGGAGGCFGNGCLEGAARLAGDGEDVDVADADVGGARLGADDDAGVPAAVLRDARAEARRGDRVTPGLRTGEIADDEGVSAGGGQG